MMHSQVIQNQKYFPIHILYQTFQKFDHGLGVHCVLINHKANFALVGYSRDQTDMLPFCRKTDSRSFSPWGITPAMIAVTVKPRFVTPVNFSPLFLGSFGDFGILFFQPFLNSSWILLISSSQRLLRSESPSVQVFSNCPDGHVSGVNPFNQLLHSNSGPQSKWKFQLVRYLVLNQFLNFLFLLTCQGAVRAGLTTSLLDSNSFTPRSRPCR